MNSEKTGFSEASDSKPQWKITSIVVHISEKLSAVTWRWRYDRQTFAAFLGRYGAHVSILILVLLVGIVRHGSLVPIAIAESSQPVVSLLPLVTTEPLVTATEETAVPNTLL
jgi:hypothetical protein